MTSEYGIAVIGAGDMGNRHIEAWQHLGHRVVSLADIDVERARETASTYGIPSVHHQYQDAIAEDGIDIVSICLPLALHAPVTIHAAEHGRHVFCEKPLARDFAEADAMERAVRDADVQFGLGFQRNLAEGVSLLRSWAAEGRFGRPMVFTSDLLQGVRPKRAMHDRNGNNGPLTDTGCHYYLQWQTVFRSRPKSVYAQGRILAMDRPEISHFDQIAIDTAVVTMEFESGDIATMTVSWGLAEGFRMHSRPDRLVGPKGGAEGNVQRELTLYTECDTETVTIAPRNLHALEFARFADAIEERTRPAYGFREGRQMIAITQAIHESIATGRPVAMAYDR
jgi:predicted dehydrogenase